MTIGCAIKQNNTMTSKTENNFQYKIFTATFQMYMYILANYVLPVLCVLHIKIPHTTHCKIVNNWSQTAHKIEFFYHVPLYIVMCENKDCIKYNANKYAITLKCSKGCIRNINKKYKT